MQNLNEFLVGWRTLLGAIVGVGSGLTGIVFYTHGVFVIPITSEFGWSRGETQFAFSFVMFAVVLLCRFGWLLRFSCCRARVSGLLM